MTEALRKEFESKLWQLHAELTDFFLEALKNRQAKASMTAEIVSFLAHNGITIQNKRMLAYGLEGLRGESEELELPFLGEGNA